MTKRLAIIPARGGSKRIPKKNIRNFCGKPMISYILNSAAKSNLFEKIHISSDCEEIISCVSKLNYQPDFIRPAYLSGDFTPIMEVLKFVVEKYKSLNEIFDEIWLLMACSPLIKSSHLVDAASQYKSNYANKLLAVCEYSVPIEWAFDMGENNNLFPINPGKFSIRSQDIKKTYYDAGAFAIFKNEHILSLNLDKNDEGFVGYILNKNVAIDIDDEDDWQLAELMYKRNYQKKLSIKKTLL